MELWLNLGGEKKKYQGSFRKVMEQVAEEGRGKEVKLLSFHASQKERRRLKRELRANGKDIVATAQNITKWFYNIDRRRLKRRIAYLRKRARYTSKGEVFYCPSLLKRVEELRKELEKIEKKLSAA
jgi:hypothetical protein